MRAIGIPEYGGPEVLEVVEVDVREAGPGEVRVRVAAAAVNPTDLLTRSGAAAAGYRDLPLPLVPGMDAAGTVESVGPGVDRLAVGDQVMAIVLPRRPEGGAQAELVVVPAASVVPVPDGATAEQAATLPMNGLAALQALDLLDLPTGATLLITGGAGHLSALAIPLAKVPVAGTVTPERAAEAHRRMEAGGVRGRWIVVFPAVNEP